MEAHDTLLRVLRDELGLLGTKQGCDTGGCGCCTVLIDGQAAYSCMLFAMAAQGKRITTIEGLKSDGKLDALQEAFMACHGLQCGFCTPGVLMSACALLRQEPNPSEAQITEALEGNLCRCTGYVNIVASVQQAAQTLAAKGERA